MRRLDIPYYTRLPTDIAMQPYVARERHPRYRSPLSDTTTHVNNKASPTPPPRRTNTQIIRPPPTTHLKHHESRDPEWSLQIRIDQRSPTSNAENKRLSTITDESQRNSKRDSAYSTNSTASGNGRRRKTHVGMWHLGKTVGKGASGRVRLAKHRLTGQLAAVKIVSKRSAALLRSSSLATSNVLSSTMSVDPNGKRVMPFGIEREVVIMKLIEHPAIIRLYDIWENRGEL